MNIVYIHGLDSKLSAEKRNVLEKYGQVYAPDLNYYNDPNAINTILNYYPNVKIDVVIGSSMGGFAGYYVANALNKPALLFNPALVKRSVAQNIPEDLNSYNSLKQIVLGQQDDVVNPAETLGFLPNDFNTTTNVYLRLVPHNGHNIPIPLFEEEVRSFFDKLS